MADSDKLPYSKTEMYAKSGHCMTGIIKIYEHFTQQGLFPKPQNPEEC